MSLQEDMIFELIEGEADLNIFIDREGFTSKGPAITITSNSLGHFPKRKSDKFTLWFGRGIIRESFKSFQEAVDKSTEILKKTDTKLSFRFEGKKSKTIKKYWKWTQ